MSLKDRAVDIYVDLCLAFYAVQTKHFLRLFEIKDANKIQDWTEQLRVYCDAIQAWARRGGKFVITYGSARNMAVENSQDTLAGMNAVTEVCAANGIAIGNGGGDSGVMGYISKNLIKHATKGGFTYRLFLIPLLWLGNPGTGGQTEEAFADKENPNIIEGPPFAEIGLRRFALNLLVAFGKNKFKSLIVFMGGIGTLDEICVHLLYNQLRSTVNPYGQKSKTLFIWDTKFEHPRDGQVYLWRGLMIQLEDFWYAKTAEEPPKHNVVVLRIAHDCDSTVAEKNGFRVVYDTVENLARFATCEKALPKAA